MSQFQSAYDAYGSDGFVVLAVNYQESADTITDFLSERHIAYPVLMDEAGSINSNLYNVQGYPTSYLINRDGVIVRVFPGSMDFPTLFESLGDLLQQG